MLYYTLVTIPDERNKTLTVTVKIISYLRLDVVISGVQGSSLTKLFTNRT